MNTTPALFVGHGSPMMVIEPNPYRSAWEKLGGSLSKPRAILCISAHWQTPTPTLCTAAHPRTIHDFYGFPAELFAIRYPAPGAPFLADELSALMHASTPPLTLKRDESWGLDHGAWSVLRSLFPAADVPVAQLSLAQDYSFAEHVNLAQAIRPLREQGVMVVASGNITHNLRQLSRDQVLPWAVDFDNLVATALMHHDINRLINIETESDHYPLAVPTAEHYLPMLYAAGLRMPDDRLEFFSEGFDLGSLSMRSFMMS